MFYGTGKMSVKLLRANGTTEATIVLLRPTAREIEDFEEVFENLGPDQFGEPVDELRGVRFRGVYHFTGTAQNQSEMAQLMRVANWRGAGRKVRLWPHEEQTGIRVLCEVRGHRQQPLNGQIYGDRVTIEFRGLELLPLKPNPTLERRSSTRADHSVVAGESFGS